MKRVAFAFAAMLVWAKPAALHAEDGVIDLAALPNYARQAKPSYIFGDNTPVAPGPSPVANPLGAWRAPFAPLVSGTLAASIGSSLLAALAHASRPLPLPYLALPLFHILYSAPEQPRM